MLPRFAGAFNETTLIEGRCELVLDMVLKAWECCDPFNRRCFECPYENDCFHDGFDRVAIADMVKLLKESNRSKHGHWIVLQNCSNSGVYCSECMNKMFDRYPMKKKFSQYCGHCGAHNDLQIEIR